MAAVLAEFASSPKKKQAKSQKIFHTDTGIQPTKMAGAPLVTASIEQMIQEEMKKVDVAKRFDTEQPSSQKFVEEVKEESDNGNTMA